MPKKKNKFKKNKKHQVENVTLATQSAMDADSSGELPENVIEANPQPIEEESDMYDVKEYEHVKKDVKKIVTITTIIVLILIATYLLSFKTSALSTFGDWVYRLLNIQTS